MNMTKEIESQNVLKKTDITVRNVTHSLESANIRTIFNSSGAFSLSVFWQLAAAEIHRPSLPLSPSSTESVRCGNVALEYILFPLSRVGWVVPCLHLLHQQGWESLAYWTETLLFTTQTSLLIVDRSPVQSIWRKDFKEVRKTSAAFSG